MTTRIWHPKEEPMDTIRDDSLIKLVLNTIETMKQEQAINDSKSKAGTLRVCPECHHVFKGSNWGGIDAHWRAHHETVRYEEAWPLIKAGQYKQTRAGCLS
jgi:hypothetical protein